MNNHQRDLMGVGNNAATETNAEGGLSSVAAGRFDLLPPLALQAVAMNMQYGANKYEKWNWLLIPSDSHLNHALIHCYAHISGDETETEPKPFDSDVTHLIHAATRLLMALDVELRKY